MAAAPPRSEPRDSGGARLERVAIEVPDLESWVARFERLLGPGFERHVVARAAGPLSIAIHPAGIELVQGPADTRPHLRSFHLATPGPGWATDILAELGWPVVDNVVLDGRRHDFVDALGLRCVLVGPADDYAGRDDPVAGPPG